MAVFRGGIVKYRDPMAQFVAEIAIGAVRGALTGTIRAGDIALAEHHLSHRQ